MVPTMMFRPQGLLLVPKDPHPCRPSGSPGRFGPCEPLWSSSPTDTTPCGRQVQTTRHVASHIGEILEVSTPDRPAAQRRHHVFAVTFLEQSGPPANL